MSDMQRCVDDARVAIEKVMQNQAIANNPKLVLDLISAELRPGKGFSESMKRAESATGYFHTNDVKACRNFARLIRTRTQQLLETCTNVKLKLDGKKPDGRAKHAVLEERPAEPKIEKYFMGVYDTLVIIDESLEALEDFIKHEVYPLIKQASVNQSAELASVDRKRKR